MTKPDIDALIKALGVQERILLFRLASRTDWKQAGVTRAATINGDWFEILEPEEARFGMTEPAPAIEL